MSPELTPKQAINEIIHWTLTYYDDGQGGLPRSVKQDGTGRKARLFNDLGDYLPFFAYLKQKDFCLKQLKDTENILTKESLLPAEFTYFGMPCTRSYEHTDLLLGLADTYSFFPSDPLKSLIQRVSTSVIQTYHPEKKSPSSWYFPTTGFRLPIFDFKDGMFIEIWTSLARTFDEPRYLRIAERLAFNLMQMTPKNFFPLVPNLTGTNIFGRAIVETRLRSARTKYTPMKYFSNTAYAFLELYKATGKEEYRAHLVQMKDAIIRYALDSKNRIVEFSTSNGMAIHTEHAQLVQNFPVMDWAADCYYFLHDKEFLNLAEKIALSWMELQDENTGLIPQSTDCTDTDLDNLTDTFIAFSKISELSNDPKYLNAAKRIMTGILTYHRKPDLKGYVLMVNTYTGETTCPELKIKFITLFLKALIVLDEQRPIYNTELYELTKDR
ncbi:MAG: hypothetical protein KIH65_000695 [Candidatus Uhrbacteria bacterium]|nr:hypothetical protein [Candidatus Uhrbacteria bacterium]